MQWFEVDKAGLGKLLERRGRAFIIYELIQNGWDQDVTQVNVKLIKEPGSRYATLTVEDDDPNGFADLSHAFTLFAESTKSRNAAQRGRFNLGEKLVLALCDEAEIITTTGGVRFDATGRHTLRRKRKRGSLFTGRIKMTNTEYQECADAVRLLIPPSDITTTFSTNTFSLNDDYVLEVRNPVAEFDASLPTVIADDEGMLRNTTRKTKVTVYEPADGEVGMIYEMGIPVVETGDRFHVNIAQKVPVNFDRDNVPPAYLRDVRTLVLNNVHERIISSEEANAGWVRDALADENIAPEAVTAMVKLRFTEKAVAFDPTDLEANKRAVASGYVVVHGSQLSKAEWRNVRDAGVLPSAGRVTPSAKAFSDDPNADLVQHIPWDKMTEAEQRVIAASARLGKLLLGFTPEVHLVLDMNGNTIGAWGNHSLYYSRRKLGYRFFQECADAGRFTQRALDLLIHEFGHEYCSDHLDDGFANALTRLGAKLALAVADQGPKLLKV